MSTLDHNFNEIAEDKARSASYPPPFSIRFTFEERARLDAERGRHSLAAYIRERLFGDEASVRKKPGNTSVGDVEALGRVLGALGNSRLSQNINQLASLLVYKRKTIHNPEILFANR